MGKIPIIVANLIDWSISFTSKNGSFYCGTTNEQKEKTAKIIEIADIVINVTDLHPLSSYEYKINGGLYPAHNIVDPTKYGKDFVYMLGASGEELKLDDKSMSPCLTDIINESVKGRKDGIIVPRSVYFQDDNKEPICSPNDIENTFGSKIISKKEFLDGDFNFIIAPKQYWDGTRIDCEEDIPKDKYDKIPESNYNVFTLLKQKYPKDKYDLIFINTGVVEGICRLHTSVGVRHLFRQNRIINISDATTPLYGIGLGFETDQQSRDACMRVGKDLGIDYMTTKDCISYIKNIKEGK
jgi:hypothetical protein